MAYAAEHGRKPARLSATGLDDQGLETHHGLRTREATNGPLSARQGPSRAVGTWRSATGRRPHAAKVRFRRRKPDMARAQPERRRRGRNRGCWFAAEKRTLSTPA
jgi:hypothetical protein